MVYPRHCLKHNQDQILATPTMNGHAPAIQGPCWKCERWEIGSSTSAMIKNTGIVGSPRSDTLVHGFYSHREGKRNMAINERNFHDVDLNLMVTFLVLYRELSVTRAATLMKVGQPAVSGSLARLRAHFDDPLFLRTGRGVRPTNKAVEIAESLMPALSRIETILTGNVHRLSDGEGRGQP
jgi:hypothetical protein